MDTNKKTMGKEDLGASSGASKRMGIFRRPRSASLGGTPKQLPKREKRFAPSPLEDRIPKKGKRNISPTYAAATRGQTPQKDREWQLVARKEEKKKKEVPVPSAQEPREKGKMPQRSPATRSGDAISLSAKDGEYRARQATPRGPVQAVQALRRCADCGSECVKGQQGE